MKWHEDQKLRKKIGDGAEGLFEIQVRCHCGSTFNFIGDQGIGFPDFSCDDCEQLVDVKTSPQMESTGNIAVSAIPWENYPDTILLATFYRGRWRGQYKSNIRPINDKPFESTHHSIGKFKNTKFYLIALKDFQLLIDLGYSVNKAKL